MARTKKNDVKPFEQWEIALVKSRARSMIGKYGLLLSDLEDVEQELFLSIIKKRKLFPVKDDPKESTRRIVDDAASSLFRKLKRHKRSILSQSTSLDTIIDPIEMTTIGQSLTENDAIGRVGRIDLSDEEEMRIDFETGFRSLTPNQQKVYRVLERVGNKRDAAKVLGINRVTLYETINRIRKTFYKHGIIKKF